MSRSSRFHGKSPRRANASETTGFRCAPETAPMNRMIAVTMRPGATTAAATLIWPLACSNPPPAATKTNKNVPNALSRGVGASREGADQVRLCRSVIAATGVP
jgi:hypothetical protein